jgi:hypothetical protein
MWRLRSESEKKVLLLLESSKIEKARLYWATVRG